MNRKFKIELDIVDGEGAELTPTEAAKHFQVWLKEEIEGALVMEVTRIEVTCA